MEILFAMTLTEVYFNGTGQVWKLIDGMQMPDPAPGIRMLGAFSSVQK